MVGEAKEGDEWKDALWKDCEAEGTADEGAEEEDTNEGGRGDKELLIDNEGEGAFEGEGEGATERVLGDAIGADVGKTDGRQLNEWLSDSFTTIGGAFSSASNSGSVSAAAADDESLFCRRASRASLCINRSISLCTISGVTSTSSRIGLASSPQKSGRREESISSERVVTATALADTGDTTEADEEQRKKEDAVTAAGGESWADSFGYDRCGAKESSEEELAFLRFHSVSVSAAFHCVQMWCGAAALESE